jgi:hypothetical protein
MGRLLARVRAMPDGAQKIIVFGVLGCTVAAIVIVIQTFG